MTKFMVAATLLACAASPAAAASFVVQNGSTASFAAPAGTVVNFNTVLPAGFRLDLINNAGIVSGDSVGQYAQPAFSDGSAYLAVGPGGSATLASAMGYDSVSFFLGSIDSYNTVQVLSTAGAVIASYTGASFSSNPNGDQELPRTNRRITITRDAVDALIGGVRFLSDSPALEVDNVVFSAVPEPSTWALMFLGFGMVGTATRYRRRRATVVFG